MVARGPPERADISEAWRRTVSLWGDVGHVARVGELGCVWLVQSSGDVGV